ncbi:peptidoglycan DD-metalloendopeptidase family protein [Parahaliea aestuarii]|uniref:Peptidoglycan DD-metalloendopeptidase family protein n=1 Tax=Parahaliea aestuarii TaxID=1852021 RepID=A0A5C8ZPD5_9GAMM|nr:peptidoglycan DD-metalloendopeptidase family protein [Parahaliea aestuarii]TXS89469.1 peptidoglycan DD-metalloendopeptidase family protein [Parahaliea aestuarii]
MTKHAKPRGATASTANSRQQKLGQHKHFLAVAILTAGVAIAAGLTPGGSVKANREVAPESDSAEQAVERILGATAELAAPPSPAADSAPPPPESNPPAAVVAAAEPPAPAWIEETVRAGDNLSLIFKRAGYDNGDVHQVVYESPQGKELSRIYPGQTVAFLAGSDGKLGGVKHIVSPLESVTYLRSEDGTFAAERIIREPEVREAWASGEITSSLFMAGQDMGLSQVKILELANIFGGVIDFVLDPRKGDTIHVVYEEHYLDGEKYRDGDIVAASFTNQGETFTAYRYQDSVGDVSYYNADGVSMRKAFLMAPVDFTRISSNFNMKRLHPIYKTTRPHRGTDYAAPTGTPVFAAGDGRVIKSGYSRPNGNYVFIQHGDRYVTKYLHLHKKHVKQGQRVSQSDVIGTVGSTGAATGPHLHYEFLVDGTHRNPRTIHKELPKAKTLPQTEMAAFQQSIAPAAQQLASLQSGNRLALNQASADAGQR